MRKYSGKVRAFIPIERETTDTADLIEQIERIRRRLIAEQPFSHTVSLRATVIATFDNVEGWAENRSEAAGLLQSRISSELEFCDVHYETSLH